MSLQSRIENTYSTEAVTFVVNPPSAGNWLANPEIIAPDQRELALYLVQLEEEGFATHADGHKVSIIWEDLYRLLTHPAHESSLPLLHLPSEARIRACLTSQGALDDADFGIFLDGWTNEMGNPLAGRAERVGGLMRFSGTDHLLSEDTWRLLEKIRAFAHIPESDKTRDRNFSEWGRIRALAKRAHAKLDRFLEDTLVLTPERLRFDLRKSEVGGSVVVEVTPTFDGAPDRWLEVFDHGRSVSCQRRFKTDTLSQRTPS